MIMQRAIIMITGDVQEAGYRAYVMKAAQKLGLAGYVENLPDGNVKVVSEGKKESIEKFIELIKIKDETIDVEEIEAKYGNATGEFDGKGFRPKISDPDYEMFQGYASAGKYFRIGWSKQDKMLWKQDKMQSTMENMHQEIKGMHHELKGFREETKGEFQTIKTDYGKISQNMENAIESINTIAKSIETLAKAIAEKK